MQDLFISSPARYLALAKLVGVQFTSAHAISEALAARMTRDALTAGDFGAIKALDPRFNVSEELFRYIVAASACLRLPLSVCQIFIRQVMLTLLRCSRPSRRSKQTEHFRSTWET